jgi:hypothetical protein
VVELVLLRDRVARESKGSAFVWYASAYDADRVSGLRLGLLYGCPVLLETLQEQLARNTTGTAC